jgi:polysaccharide deacetylase 2 family uncharacterized protein YibQ
LVEAVTAINLCGLDISNNVLGLYTYPHSGCKINIKVRLFFILLLLLPFSRYLNASKLVLIIDDIGNKQQDALAFVLPIQVTFAILPHKPLSQTFSQRAAAQQREVILHMPMESLGREKQEQGVLLSSMRPPEILQTLTSALATVPHAVGINNHMGSRLTQLTLPMSVTMDFLSAKGLFFVDSRTTRFSKAEKIAKKSGVLSTKRHVFIDHFPEQIEQQFELLIQLSKKQGYAVGIAHPYPHTIDYLQKHLGTLAQKGITLVSLTDLLLPGATNDAAEVSVVNTADNAAGISAPSRANNSVKD